MPVRFDFKGDVEAAKRLQRIAPVRTLYRSLRTGMKYQNLDQDVKVKHFDDGTTIIAESCFDNDKITIYVPERPEVAVPVVEETGTPKSYIVMYCSGFVQFTEMHGSMVDPFIAEPRVIVYDIATGEYPEIIDPELPENWTGSLYIEFPCKVSKIANWLNTVTFVSKEQNNVNNTERLLYLQHPKVWSESVGDWVYPSTADPELTYACECSDSADHPCEVGFPDAFAYICNSGGNHKSLSATHTLLKGVDGETLTSIGSCSRDGDCWSVGVWQYAGDGAGGGWEAYTKSETRKVLCDDLSVAGETGYFGSQRLTPDNGAVDAEGFTIESSYHTQMVTTEESARNDERERTITDTSGVIYYSSVEILRRDQFSDSSKTVTYTAFTPIGEFLTRENEASPVSGDNDHRTTELIETEITDFMAYASGVTNMWNGGQWCYGTEGQRDVYQATIYPNFETDTNVVNCYRNVLTLCSSNTETGVSNNVFFQFYFYHWILIDSYRKKVTAKNDVIWDIDEIEYTYPHYDFIAQAEFVYDGTKNPRDVTNYVKSGGKAVADFLYRTTGFEAKINDLINSVYDQNAREYPMILDFEAHIVEG